MVLPYVWAPYQSGTLHNAFSYGIPVVVTDMGAISEVVKEYRCGRVVEQRSPKAIAAGIKAVLGNYETYQHGVAKYREAANWEMSAQKHAKMYNETLQGYYETHGFLERRKQNTQDEAKMMCRKIVQQQEQIHKIHDKSLRLVRERIEFNSSFGVD